MWCRRRRPAMCAKMVCPLSNSTENVVLGKTWRMLPKTSSGASLTSVTVSAFETRGLALRFRLCGAIANPLFFDFNGAASTSGDARAVRLLYGGRIHEFQEARLVARDETMAVIWRGPFVVKILDAAKRGSIRAEFWKSEDVKPVFRWALLIDHSKDRAWGRKESLTNSFPMQPRHGAGAKRLQPSPRPPRSLTDLPMTADRGLSPPP
jgi:hypothetical protein